MDTPSSNEMSAETVKEIATAVSEDLAQKLTAECRNLFGELADENGRALQTMQDSLTAAVNEGHPRGDENRRVRRRSSDDDWVSGEGTFPKSL